MREGSFRTPRLLSESKPFERVRGFRDSGFHSPPILAAFLAAQPARGIPGCCPNGVVFHALDLQALPKSITLRNTGTASLQAGWRAHRNSGLSCSGTPPVREVASQTLRAKSKNVLLMPVGAASNSPQSSNASEQRTKSIPRSCRREGNRYRPGLFTARLSCDHTEIPPAFSGNGLELNAPIATHWCLRNSDPHLTHAKNRGHSPHRKRKYLGSRRPATCGPPCKIVRKWRVFRVSVFSVSLFSR